MVDDFDKFLKTRHTAQAPGHLSARIIEASRGTAQQKGVPQAGLIFYRWFRALTDNLLLPEPALALGVLLMAGFSAGFALERGYTLEQNLSVLYVEETLDVGDWL